MQQKFLTLYYVVHGIENGSDFFYFVDCESSDVRYLLGTDAECIRRTSALFLLKMKEKHRLTQVAINSIVEESRGLFYQTMERVRAAIQAKRADKGIDENIIDFDDIFESTVDPFRGLETCYLQEKYFNDQLGLAVSTIIIWFLRVKVPYPKCIVLKEKRLL